MIPTAKRFIITSDALENSRADMIEPTNILVKHLAEKLIGSGRAGDSFKITTLNPGEITDVQILSANIFFYYVHEKEYLQNRVPKPGDQKRPAPGFLYHLLISAYSPEPDLQDQNLLTEICELFSNTPIIVSEDKKHRYGIRQANVSPETLFLLWRALRSPLRPSILYSLEDLQGM